MTDQYVLPDELPVHRDESMAGLLMRYAGFYGIDVPHKLLVSLGQGARTLPTFAALDPASHDGAALGRFLNLSSETSHAMSNWDPRATYTKVLGSAVFTDLTDCWTRQVCPSCLAGAPYHRASWLLAAVPACPDHGCTLLDCCPVCDARLKWSGKNVFACSACQADLRSLPTPALPADEVAAVQGVIGLFRHGRPHASGLAPGDMLHAVYEIGRVRTGLHEAGRAAGNITRHREALPRILASGWHTLDPWPGAYRAFLEELTSGSAGREAKRGFAKEFGPFAEKLHDNRHNAWAIPLGSELADYAIGRPGLDIRSSYLRSRGSGRHEGERQYSFNEAARLLGVSIDTVQRTSARLKMNMVESGPGIERKLRGSDVRRLVELQAARTDALSLGAAATVLGISVPTLKKLVALDLVKDIPRSDRVRTRDAFLQANLTEFLEIFEMAAGSAPEVDDPSGTFRTLGVAGSSDGFGILRICSEVAAGTLKPIAIWKAGKGLQRYLFPRFISPNARARTPKRKSSDLDPSQQLSAGDRTGH